MRIFLSLVAACLVGCTLSQRTRNLQEVSKGAGEKRVVCYYTNWSVYRKGLAKYEPGNINPYLCTHLVYAFGGLTDEFEMAPFDSYQDIEQGGYAKFNGLKQYNKAMKTLLAVGGWNEGSARFSELVSQPEYRQNFTISSIRHLRRYKFDGLDLDWEYPGSREGSTPDDKRNYAILVQELREAFDKESTRSSKPRLLLTMAVPAGQSTIDKGFDIPTLNKHLDFFNILTYDYHSTFEPTVNHHASLQAPPGVSEYEWDAQLNVDWTIKYYLQKGAAKNKLVMGIPTYGRSYTLLDGQFHTLGSSANGPGVKGKYTNEKGYLAFYEICEAISVESWEVKKPYPKRIGPIAFKGNQWVGYDDEKIVARKAEYVRDNDLGGIMFWTLDSDDFRGLCNGRQYPLIEAAKEALYQVSESSVNEARALAPVSVGSSVSNRVNSLSDRRNKRPQQSVATTTAKPGRRQRPSGGATIAPHNTPEPPTTPSAIKGFNCKREGYHPNPEDCHKYYRCLDSGASGLGIVAHTFSCPSDLVFNKKLDGCDHPNSVKCTTTLSRGGSEVTQPTTTAIPRTTEFDYTLLQDDYDYYYGGGDYNYDVDAPLEENIQNVVEPETTSVVRNSGGNQFEGLKTAAEVDEAAAPAREATRGALGGGRTRPQYSAIERDRSRAPQTEDVAAPVEEDQQSPSRPNRLQYVTLNRQRPALPVVTEGREETEQLPEEVESSTQRGGLNYVTLSRRRPSTVDTHVEETTAAGPGAGLEYVTISRLRPSTTTELDPPFFNPIDFVDGEPEVAVETPEESIVTEPPTPKPRIRIPTIKTRTVNPRPPQSFRRRITGGTKEKQDLNEPTTVLEENDKALVSDSLADEPSQPVSQPTRKSPPRRPGLRPRTEIVSREERPAVRVRQRPKPLLPAVKEEDLISLIPISEVGSEPKITEVITETVELKPKPVTTLTSEQSHKETPSAGSSLLERTQNLFSQQVTIPEEKEEKQTPEEIAKETESLIEETLALLSGGIEESNHNIEADVTLTEESPLPESEVVINEIPLETARTFSDSDGSPVNEALLLFDREIAPVSIPLSSENPEVNHKVESATVAKEEESTTVTIPVSPKLRPIVIRPSSSTQASPIDQNSELEHVANDIFLPLESTLDPVHHHTFTSLNHTHDHPSINILNDSFIISNGNNNTKFPNPQLTMLEKHKNELSQNYTNILHETESLINTTTLHSSPSYTADLSSLHLKLTEIELALKTINQFLFNFNPEFSNFNSKGSSIKEGTSESLINDRREQTSEKEVQTIIPTITNSFPSAKEDATTQTDKIDIDESEMDGQGTLTDNIQFGIPSIQHPHEIHDLVIQESSTNVTRIIEDHKNFPKQVLPLENSTVFSDDVPSNFTDDGYDHLRDSSLINDNLELNIRDAEDKGNVIPSIHIDAKIINTSSLDSNSEVELEKTKLDNIQNPSISEDDFHRGPHRLKILGSDVQGINSDGHSFRRRKVLRSRIVTSPVRAVVGNIEQILNPEDVKNPEFEIDKNSRSTFPERILNTTTEITAHVANTDDKRIINEGSDSSFFEAHLSLPDTTNSSDSFDDNFADYDSYIREEKPIFTDTSIVANEPRFENSVIYSGINLNDRTSNDKGNNGQSQSDKDLINQSASVIDDHLMLHLSKLETKSDAIISPSLEIDNKLPRNENSSKGVNDYELGFTNAFNFNASLDADFPEYESFLTSKDESDQSNSSNIVRIVIELPASNDNTLQMHENKLLESSIEKESLQQNEFFPNDLRNSIFIYTNHSQFNSSLSEVNFRDEETLNSQNHFDLIERLKAIPVTPARIQPFDNEGSDALDIIPVTENSINLTDETFREINDTLTDDHINNLPILKISRFPGPTISPLRVSPNVVPVFIGDSANYLTSFLNNNDHQRIDPSIQIKQSLQTDKTAFIPLKHDRIDPSINVKKGLQKDDAENSFITFEHEEIDSSIQIMQIDKTDDSFTHFEHEDFDPSIQIKQSLQTGNADDLFTPLEHEEIDLSVQIKHSLQTGNADHSFTPLEHEEIDPSVQIKQSLQTGNADDLFTPLEHEEIDPSDQIKHSLQTGNADDSFTPLEHEEIDPSVQIKHSLQIDNASDTFTPNEDDHPATNATPTNDQIEDYEIDFLSLHNGSDTQIAPLQNVIPPLVEHLNNGKQDHVNSLDNLLSESQIFGDLLGSKSNKTHDHKNTQFVDATNLSLSLLQIPLLSQIDKSLAVNRERSLDSLKSVHVPNDQSTFKVVDLSLHDQMGVVESLLSSRETLIKNKNQFTLPYNNPILHDTVSPQKNELGANHSNADFTNEDAIYDDYYTYYDYEYDESNLESIYHSLFTTTKPNNNSTHAESQHLSSKTLVLPQSSQHSVSSDVFGNDKRKQMAIRAVDEHLNKFLDFTNNSNNVSHNLLEFPASDTEAVLIDKGSGEKFLLPTEILGSDYENFVII